MVKKQEIRAIINLQKRGGDLDYEIVWISLDGRLSTQSYNSYQEAYQHYRRLNKELKRQPTILFRIEPEVMDVIEEDLK